MSAVLLKPQLVRFRSAGFTLIEVLVVLVILGVMSSMAVISFRNDPVTQLEREQLRLQGLLNFAADEAVLQGLLLGLTADQRSYQLVLFDTESQAWQRREGRYFEAYSLPEPITVSISLDGEQLTEQEQQQIALLSKASGVEQIAPAMLFLSSGEITPFTLTFQHLLADQSLQLSSDGFSGIKVN